MVAYLTDVGPLSPLQSGFRPGHNTVMALLNITYDISGMLDQGYFVALVLLDFSKAFDSIDHLLLCRKWESRYGFSSSAVSFLSSYLYLKFECVSSGGRLSDKLLVNIGVTQGSVLGPLLFSLFIDDLCGAVLTSNYHLYADDSDCIHRLNVDLEATFRWSIENGLSLNRGKTQVMIICKDKGRLPALLPAVLVNGRTVPYSASVKNLGLTMGNRFS
jgi:hypothetical protein